MVSALFMTHRFKFVAVILAFMLLASGLSVFGICLRGESVVTHKCCGPHCQSMAKAPSAPDIALHSKAATDRPCCNISSGKLIPAPELQAPSTRLIVAPLTPVVELFVSTLLAAETDLRDGVSLFRSSPPRTVLCTFLI
jgi:hypothetical protein